MLSKAFENHLNEEVRNKKQDVISKHEDLLSIVKKAQTQMVWPYLC